MSNKNGSGKSLKGIDPTQQLDLKALFGGSGSSGMTLNNPVLQGAIIYGSLADDIAIGTVQPSTGRFLTLEVGLPNVGGGSFLAWGTDAGREVFDENGTLLSRVGGDRVQWDPDTANFNVQGSLTVRDAVELGNIRIIENTITAVKNDNIYLRPTTAGSVFVGGNIRQDIAGVVDFGEATQFFTDSLTSSNINARYDNTISTDHGDIKLVTDNRANVGITSVTHFQRSTRTDVQGTTTIGYDQTIDNGGNDLQQIRTTTRLGVIREIETTRKTKTVKDGQVATKTVISTTTITPATDNTVEKRETINYTTTTIDALEPPDYSTLPDAVTVHSAIITTSEPHGLLTGDAINIDGTDVDAVNDQSFPVSGVLSKNQISVTVPDFFTDALVSSGNITQDRQGSILLHASDEVNFNLNVPLTFGTNGQNGPSLVAVDDENLALKAKYITLSDPIPAIGTGGTIGSDTGLEVVNYGNGNVGFFGAVDNVFKWIPNATISDIGEPGISKNVTGAPGAIEASQITANKVVARSISSNGDLTFEATNGGRIVFASETPIQLNVPLELGENSAISTDEDGNLTVDADNDLLLKSGGDIRIPCGKKLIFCDNASISSDAQGLTVSSSLPVNFDNTVKIADDLQLGSVGARISADDTGAIKFDASEVQLPKIIRIDGTATIEKNTTGDLVFSSGTGNIRLDPAQGKLYISAVQTVFPTQAELAFGANATIATSSSGTLTFQSKLIQMNASEAVLIPVDTALRFENDGTKIYKSSVDGKLHITNAAGQVLVDGDTTINGHLIVNGTTEQIESTTTRLRDPFIILGAGDAEYLKDRGVQFYYGDGKTGFIGFSQTTNRFYMVREGQNNADIVTQSAMGDLEIANLYAKLVQAETVAASLGVNTSLITGQPDLHLAARRLLFDATEYAGLPLGVPLRFGVAENRITGYSDRLEVTAPRVDFSNGSIRIGQTTLTSNTTDTGNGNVLAIDGTIKVPDLIQIGDGISFRRNDDGTLVVGAPRTEYTGPLTIKDELQFGDANVTWNAANGTVHWQNTTMQIDGSILDATWQGKAISTAYGGTGSVGPWHARSVIFVDETSQIFREDTSGFNYNPNTRCLGIRTDQQNSAVTVGSGDLEFLHNDSKIQFSGSSGPWTVSAKSSVFSISHSTEAIIQAMPDGRIGLGATLTYMTSTQLQHRLHVFGNCYFPQDDTGLVFPRAVVTGGIHELSLISQQGIIIRAVETTTIESQKLIIQTSAETSFHASGAWSVVTNEHVTVSATKAIDLLSQDFVRLNSPLIFGQSSQYAPRIFSHSTDIVEFQSLEEIILQSHHVVIPQRLCLHHHPTSNVCESYLTRNGTDVIFRNTAGNIVLDPTNNVTIPESKLIAFGATGSIIGSIGAVGSTLVVDSVESIHLAAQVAIGHNGPNNTPPLLIAAEGEKVTVTTPKPILFDTPAINIPDHTPIAFGNVGRRIESDGDSLFIYGGDLITLDANNVRLTGNLIVDKKSTFTIESEASFDSGIIRLGGGQKNDIVDIQRFQTDTTRVTLATDHHLRVGDQVTISDTIPNIDGSYTVLDGSDESSIVIQKVYPGIVPGADVQGNVRTLLVTNTGYDAGNEIAWHTGLPPQTTDGARTAFYGFDRSSLRWTYIPDATRTGNTYSGEKGDIDIGALYASNGISAPKLLSSLDAATFALSGSNFQITGGAINGTPIGLDAPSEGRFTRIAVLDSSVVSNLNADLLDGLHADAFVKRDGTTPLTADWYAGGDRIITTGGYKDLSLLPAGIVTVGPDGRLITSADATLVNGIFTVNLMSGFKLTGPIDLNGFTIRGGNIENCTVTRSDMTESTISTSTMTTSTVSSSTVSTSTVVSSTITSSTVEGSVINSSTFTQGDITSSNITVPTGNTLDLTSGTITLRDDQISGDKIAGGTADIDISGNSATVTDGLYHRDFTDDYTILKADAAGIVEALHIPQNSFVGRLENGIETIPIQTIVDLSGKNLYVPNSILKSDTDKSPEALVIPEKTLVGRLTDGEVSALSVQEVRELLEIEKAITIQTLYDKGALLRDGHRTIFSGAQMTGLLFTNYERFTMLTGQTHEIDVNCETSYITVHHSETSQVATCTFADGLVDGHRKFIVLSELAENSVLLVRCKYVAPGNPDPHVLVFHLSGQSGFFQWDSVLRSWLIIGTGPLDLTRDAVRQTDWVDKVLGPNN